MPVPRIQPSFGFQGTTRIVTLPGDPALAFVPGFSAKETRFALEDGRWHPSILAWRARAPASLISTPERGLPSWPSR